MIFKANIILCSVIFLFGLSHDYFAQKNIPISDSLSIISFAPVKYRVNTSDGKSLHGYFNKHYSLNIYGNENIIGYRADCDMDDDWSGAVVQGTTQASNSFESKYSCVFNPHILYGTVLPGNKSGQSHFDNTRHLGVDIGDLTLTYKLDSKGKIIDSIIGVVFDCGPHNQPGESSVATCKSLQVVYDNNAFIYFVFPNSRKYLVQLIGIFPDGNQLIRNPTNEDFIQAFELMKADGSKNTIIRDRLQAKLMGFLILEANIERFDNPTIEEKSEGLKMPKNNDRNSNR